MKQSQGQRIVEMLRRSPTKTVTCRELANVGLYHKAASRIGEMVRAHGHTIKFTPGDSWDTGFYTLEFDAGDPQKEELKPVEFFEQEGQRCFQ